MLRRSVILLIVYIVGGCVIERRICPTYQSAFVHNKNERKKMFGYFNDSEQNPLNISASVGDEIVLPPLEQRTIHSEPDELYAQPIPFDERVEKGQYLLLKKRSNAKTLKDMRTLPAVQQYFDPDSVMLAERALADSVARADSTYMITLQREKYNLDQDYYNWYLRKELVLPDVRIQEENKIDEDSMVEEKLSRKEKRRLAKLQSDSLSVQENNAAMDTLKTNKKRRKRKKKETADQENGDS